MHQKNNFKTFLVILIFSSLTLNCQEKEQLDVPYVPTPMPVVEGMMRLAEIQKDDILYDLGCGDGRILITAARKYGIRGVGVDLDPERIRECRENAKKAEVDHLVQFYQKNLFHTDFHEATIVTLYLLPSVNIQLRPKLLDELSPGTKVISHDFDMDEWLADESIQVWADDEIHMLYFWEVPANVSGTWDLSFNKPLNGYEPEQLQFQQIFQFPQGNVVIKEDHIAIQDEKLEGNKLAFSFLYSGLKWELDGAFSRESMKGTARLSGTQRTVSWKAERRSGTKKPLAPHSIDPDSIKENF